MSHLAAPKPVAVPVRHPRDASGGELGPLATSRLTTTSWSSASDLAPEGWVGWGRWLGMVDRASGWWLGDWVRYGNARYGERYKLAARITGYDGHTLMNMAYVASRFETSRRREELSFSHHAEVAALPREAQDLWLDTAVIAQLSVRALREEVKRSAREAEAPAEGSTRRNRRRAQAAPAAHIVECPSCGHEFSSSHELSRPWRPAR
jgi:hypothetical protein